MLSPANLFFSLYSDISGCSISISFSDARSLCNPPEGYQGVNHFLPGVVTLSVFVSIQLSWSACIMHVYHGDRTRTSVKACIIRHLISLPQQDGAQLRNEEAPCSVSCLRCYSHAGNADICGDWRPWRQVGLRWWLTFCSSSRHDDWWVMSPTVPSQSFYCRVNIPHSRFKHDCPADCVHTFKKGSTLNTE